MQTRQIARTTAGAPVNELRVFLLGPFRIEGPAGPIDLPTRKSESLLAYLVLHPEPHARERLASMYWGGATDSQARNSLRNALTVLRKRLGDPCLLIDRESVQLNPQFPLWADAPAFQAQAESFLALLSPAPAQAGVDLYRGGLLQEYYDDWIAPERERLRLLYLEVLLRLTELSRARSEYERAIGYARRALAADPASERAHQHLMFCYLATGDRAAALRQYEECRQVLHAELAVEPAPESTELYRWIQQASGARSHAALLTNLPLPLSSFIGRQRAMAEVKALLQKVRLLTLTGAGGSGKTRLAIQVATDLVDAFEDGVWRVDVEHVGDESLVAPAVAKALGVSEVPQQALAETLGGYLRTRRLLLLVDNCEHLVAACARLAETLLDACPRLSILVTSREPLGINGERVWQVPTLALPPLGAGPDVPGPEQPPTASAGSARDSFSPQDWLQYEAVRLFVERAQAARADFVFDAQQAPGVSQICRQLDGIPLAIELAAARVKALSVEQIAARLDDRFTLLGGDSRTARPRQQTLRAMVDWSFGLLSDDERVLFRRLAVFHGGRSLEAVEAVCAGDGIAQPDVPGLLARLADKSLIYVEDLHGAARYRFLETMRQYAVARLEESGEAEPLRSRHLAYFLAMAEEGHEGLRSHEQSEWLDRLESEHDNLLAALAWARSSGRLEPALQMAGALWLFWYLRGYWAEGRRSFNAVLAECGWRITDRGVEVPGRINPSPWLARALHGDGQLTYGQGNPVVARALIEQSLTLWRRLDQPQGLARALNALGEALFRQRDYAAAQALYQESLALWRGLQYTHGIAIGLNNLGVLSQESGDYRAARAFFGEALALWRARGDRRGVAEAHYSLAVNAQLEGDYGQAETLFQDCLAIRRELGLKSKIADALQGLAEVARLRADDDAARTYGQEGLALQRELGSPDGAGWCLLILGHIALHAGDPQRAGRCFGEGLRLFRQSDGLPGVAACLGAFGALATGAAQFARAARLFGAAQAVLARSGARLQEAYRSEAALALARAQLGAAPFDREWQAGSTRALADAIGMALEET